MGYWPASASWWRVSGPDTSRTGVRLLRRGWLQQLTRIQVLLPLVVGVGLLAYVVSIAIAPESGGQLWRIVRETWWLVLLLTFPYLALRALVWHDLLATLGLEVPWRPMLVAFAGGEITKSLPAGLYVQNYLLARLEHFGHEAVARATMASTAMLGLEAALAVPVALVVGWPGRPTVRWVLIAIVAAWVAGLGLAWLLVRFGLRRMPPTAPEWLRRGTLFLEEFLAAGGDLLTWRTTRNLVPTALYMLIYVADLYAILRALDITSIGVVDAIGIYAFVVLSVILVPVPTEVGLTEFGGLMALIAHGVSEPTAAIIILSLRAQATGMTIAVASVALLVLRWRGGAPRERLGAVGAGDSGRAPTHGARHDIMAQPDTPQPPRHRRVASWVRQRADLKIVLPVAITLGLVGYVSALAASPQGGTYLWAIVGQTWWIVLLLGVPYLGARAFLWHELLEQLDIRVPWRPMLAALAGGELAKTFPGGVYVQNYILARLEGFGELPIVRSSTATTATLALESALALPVALVVGLPNSPWLPWTLVGTVVAWLAVLVLLRLLVRYWEVHLAGWTPSWVRRGLLITDEFLDAAVELATWRTARALVPTAVYMLVYVADLYVIVVAAGVHTMTFVQVMGIYAVVVLAVILVPVPAKLGTTELSGVTAFVAFGVPGSTAAVIMLGLRLLATGATMLLAAALLIALRGELTNPSGPAADRGLRGASGRPCG